MQEELNRFLRYLKVEKGCSPGTIEAYQRDLEKGLFLFLNIQGKSGLSLVTKADIRAYLDFLTFEKGNSPISRRRKLAAIKSFFSYLVENEKLPANPTASVRSPRIADSKPVYLNEAECLQLVKTVAKVAKPRVKDRDMAIVLLFLHTGLRVSELINLKLYDIDLRSAQMKVTRKGNREQYLHLNSEVASALQRYLITRQSQGSYVFVGSWGQKLNRNYIYDRIRTYLAAAGVTKGKKGPHILRHTFCTRLHKKGVDPMVIKELAGHQNLNTTMRYVSIKNKEQADAVDRLELGIFLLFLFLNLELW